MAILPTMSQNEPFVCSLSHQEAALTIPSALILMSQCEIFAYHCPNNNKSSRYHRQFSPLKSNGPIQ